ncbi:MAG: hypothetical protein ACPGO5_00055 [Patescibacteria group bacterium]
MDTQVIKHAQETYKDLSAVVSVYTMSFIWSTQDFAKSLGHTQEEFKGISLRKIAVMNVSEITKMLFSELINSKGNKDTRKFYHKDGHKILGTASVEKFSFEGEPFLAIIGATFKDAPEE